MDFALILIRTVHFAAAISLAAAVSLRETALFAAYQAEKDPQKRRDFLLQDIRQWLGPLNERAKGIERIRQLQNEFPTQPNPFAYYLKTPDQKVVALFNRLSPVFVQGLLGFLDMEFPDLKTVKRPMVELKKDGSGRYRIVGNYLGNVNLRMDRLSDISFTFWLADEQWYVVATNITPERKKYASEVKARIKDKIYTADEMLIYLEGIFTREFPKSPLHESAGVSETAPPKSTKSD